MTPAEFDTLFATNVRAPFFLVQGILDRLRDGGRVGHPTDIADVVSYLVSEDARWITGQILDASGGTAH
ncbi:SDR family oxidoreductase [Nocardia fluminea]|jgi:NAD(P)-dependent dehydrogenase (short-subunit alcohol dehydrogenase family)|uniref:SDR family oxidoreductase n=1 Tax=Nocardia fluminea TaxID=134984 RepID=UPI0033F44119